VRASDGSQVACRIWRGKVGQPVVLYLHGIEGHSQWFENTASVLNERGVTVYAADRRGAGLNARDRGHLASYKTLLADTEQMLRRIAQQHTGHALVIIGNCWGAKAASVICRQDYKGVDGPLNVGVSGLVLTSPAIFTKIDFDWKTKATIGYYCLRGDRLQLKEWNIPITAQMFTNNQPYVEYIENDPLRLTKATSQFFFESNKLSKEAASASQQINLPLLILQSGNDQIVDIPKLEQWYAQVKSVDKQMRIFPDAAHSIDFDKVWFKDYTHLLGEWILARSPV